MCEIAWMVWLWIIFLFVSIRSISSILSSDHFLPTMSLTLKLQESPLLFLAKSYVFPSYYCMEEWMFGTSLQSTLPFLLNGSWWEFSLLLFSFCYPFCRDMIPKIMESRWWLHFWKKILGLCLAVNSIVDVLL